MRLLQGHSGQINALAFSPDGTALISGGADGRVLRWDFARSDEPTTLITSGAVCCLSFALSTSTFAWGGEKGTQVHDGTPWQPTTDSTTAIAFLNGGANLAIATGDRNDIAHPGSLFLLDVLKRRVSLIDSAAKSLLAVAAVADGKRLIWGGGDKRVTRWDIASQDRKQSPAHVREVRALALSPDGGNFAAADDYSIRIYDADAMQEMRLLSGHKGRVDALAYSPDGRLLSAAWDRTVRLWDAQAGQLIVSHDWEVGGIRAVAVSPDGLLAAAAGGRGAIALWDLE